MGELGKVMTPNRIQVGHASAKQLLWTQLGQCESAETKSAIKLTVLFFSISQELQLHTSD